MELKYETSCFLLVTEKFGPHYCFDLFVKDGGSAGIPPGGFGMNYAIYPDGKPFDMGSYIAKLNMAGNGEEKDKILEDLYYKLIGLIDAFEIRTEPYPAEKIN